jgi:hypothetical protein
MRDRIRRLVATWLAFTLACTLSGVAGSAQAADEPFTASVGLTLLKLPQPDGFVEPSRNVPQFRQLGERMTPPTNRLLAIFVAKADETAARSGVPPAMQRYFMVQTFRQSEQGTVTQAEFEPVKAMLRQQYQRMLDQSSALVQGQLDKAAREMGRDAGVPDLQMKVGEMKGLEVIDERELSISLLALTKYAVQVGERTEEIPMAMTITTGITRGKVVYFYAYARYSGADDLQWLRTVTRQWVQQAGEANR